MILLCNIKKYNFTLDIQKFYVHVVPKKKRAKKIKNKNKMLHRITKNPFWICVPRTFAFATIPEEAFSTGKMENRKSVFSCSRVIRKNNIHKFLFRRWYQRHHKILYGDTSFTFFYPPVFWLIFFPNYISIELLPNYKCHACARIFEDLKIILIN